MQTFKHLTWRLALFQFLQYLLMGWQQQPLVVHPQRTRKMRTCKYEWKTLRSFQNRNWFIYENICSYLISQMYLQSTFWSSGLSLGCLVLGHFSLLFYFECSGLLFISSFSCCWTFSPSEKYQICIILISAVYISWSNLFSFNLYARLQLYLSRGLVHQYYVLYAELGGLLD